MFGKNLRYYRLKRNLSMSALASQAGISSMSVSNYENGKRNPDMETVKKLAAALDIRVSDFLQSRTEGLSFRHGEFRKSGSFGKRQQKLVREETERYIEHLYCTLDILGGEILPPAPAIHQIEPGKTAEESARKIREYFRIGETGPVGNLTELLENRGFIIHGIDSDSSSFSGMNGSVGDRAYIVYNRNMTAERIRSTIVHELAHILFVPNPDEKDREKQATAISGCFLFPTEDVRRKLGLRRSSLMGPDLLLVCQEYGISAFMAVKRARQAEIISDQTECQFYIRAGAAGWKTCEPERIKKDPSFLLETLVLRALNQEDISLSRAAELLDLSAQELRSRLSESGALNASDQQ